MPPSRGRHFISAGHSHVHFPFSSQPIRAKPSRPSFPLFCFARRTQIRADPFLCSGACSLLSFTTVWLGPPPIFLHMAEAQQLSRCFPTARMHSRAEAQAVFPSCARVKPVRPIFLLILTPAQPSPGRLGFSFRRRSRLPLLFSYPHSQVDPCCHL